MRRTVVLLAVSAVFSLVLVAGASAGTKGAGGTNNGGNTPSCGAACDQSHNPTDYTKPCNPVPGNGCHQLPDTPCERGHGGTEIGNKHCGSGLAILKEQAPGPCLAGTTYTHDTINASIGLDFCYRVTVTNFSNTQYTLVGSDLLCDTGNFALETSGLFSNPQPLAPLGTDVYTCEIDMTFGAGLPGNGIPDPVTPGVVYPVTNTVIVVATPDGGGTPVTLTDTVTANFS